MMRFIRNAWLQIVVFVSICSTYLFLAPNYQWCHEPSDTPYGADFLQEWVGAKLIVSGNALKLYDVDYFKAMQHDISVVGFAWESKAYFPPVYPPPHYALFSPLAFLPYRWAAILWLLSLVLAAFVSARIIVSIVEKQAATMSGPLLQESLAKSRWLWIALLLFPSLIFSITLGQKSVYWLLIVCLTWKCLQVQRDFLAGIVFGILSVKPTLFFLLPLVMLRHRQWQFFAGASVSVIVLWGTAFCFIPMEAWLAFGKGLRSVGNYAENAGYRIEWSCNLMTLAYSVPDQWVGWCKWAICIPLSVYMIFCVFADRAYSLISGEKAMLVMAATLAISPHTYHYDLCLLLLPILWLAATSSRQGLVYYAMLAVGVTMAPDVQEYLRFPVIPVMLVGMVCELRLRGVLPVASVFNEKPTTHGDLPTFGSL